MNQDSQSKTIQLTDGRKLGYAEFGDPAGKPVFFCHGWPSSRRGPQTFPAEEISMKRFQ
jgi:pimeloyl-ACP methyl ester carboxylesterase